MYGVGAGILLLIIWLVLILPISLLVPDRSCFWQPMRLTLISVLISLVIGMPYAIWQEIGEPLPHLPFLAKLMGLLAYALLLSVIGGVTGFVAALLNRHAWFGETPAGVGRR
jgi:hypothetical protein